MNIIKHGNIKNTYMHFKCMYCGCEFNIYRGEQQVKQNCQIDIVLGNLPPYYTKCPDCTNYADGDYLYGTM